MDVEWKMFYKDKPTTYANGVFKDTDTLHHIAYRLSISFLSAGGISIDTSNLEFKQPSPNQYEFESGGDVFILQKS